MTPRDLLIYTQRMKTLLHLVAAASVLATLSMAGQAWSASVELAPNGGFEQGFDKWTLWGTNSDLITLDTKIVHSGKNSARISAGHNALYFQTPMTPGKAYEIRFFYRLEGKNPTAEVALSYYIKHGTHRSAGFKIIPIPPPVKHPKGTGWTEIRQVFMPSVTTASCQIAFQAQGQTVLCVDDISLTEVPRPAGLQPPPDPWAGLTHRTKNPLFGELLTNQPGGYTMVCWAHNLNSKNLPENRVKDFPDAASWDKQVERTYIESAANGLGYMDMPGSLRDETGPKTAAFHEELHSKYGVKFDIWTEGSGTAANAVKLGAELLNPRAKALGAKSNVSVVDPRYVEAQEKLLTDVAATMRDKPFAGVYYGRDEPSVHFPEGPSEQWGAYGKQMAVEVLKEFGYGKFAAPVLKDPAFEKDPNRPLRWIAYNRWASDRWAATRTRLYNALRAVDPKAVYSPADYWFMSGFIPFDYPRLASCTDLFEIDPYASSAEKRRGRGVYNHGFGPKFISDITGKPVRVIAQAFDYAGYKMNPEDLREWLSQSMRCGASAISYYQMDNPQYNAPDRWKMMLHLSNVISKMNRVALPTDPDTAVLYASYTHMSMGQSTGADQIYAAHALIGELAGSWYRFVADSQLERGERSLSGYKVVYLPLGKYMTSEATAKIEAYVREGGVLVCGDAEAFASDIEGNDTSKTRERILGIKVLGPKRADVIRLTDVSGFRWSTVSGAQQDRNPETAGTRLPLFEFDLWGEQSLGKARDIRVIDKSTKVLGTYPDGKPAIVSRKLGKGTVITFAANPFAPQVTVDATAWPMVFKSLQRSFGCKVDRPIWRFTLPDMAGR